MSYGQNFPPPPPITRSRGSSTASNRYMPENYLPPHQQAPPQQAPGYPYPYGMPPERPAGLTPMHSTGAYPTMAGQQIPAENTLHPASAATRPPFPTAATDPYMTSRPIYETERRASHSSNRSHHSIRSGRSHHSHHSHRSYSEDREREARHRRREMQRRHSEYDDMKPIKRHDTHRPTFGDTIYSLLGGLKSYLGPRDKY